MNKKNYEKHRKSKNHIQNERIKQLSDSNEELSSKKSSDERRMFNEKTLVNHVVRHVARTLVG